MNLSRKHKVVIAGSIIVLLALLLRMGEFFITLTYDEIWTLLNFVPHNSGRLLFDLELPNNHPLNTIAMKFVTALGAERVGIRVPDLLAGLGVIALSGVLMRKRCGDAAALWSMCFLALSAPLIVYSVQARGYMLQMFFLLVYVCGLQFSWDGQRAQDIRKRDIFLIIAGALGAMFTLVSSAVFLTAFTLLQWGGSGWKKPPRSVIAAVAGAALLSLIYLMVNVQGLMTARQWGEKFSDIGSYFLWAGNTLYALIPLLLIIPLGWELLRNKKQLPARGGFMAIILLSAIFTNGGPERVYLPLSAVFCGWAAQGTADLLARIRQTDMRKLAAAAFIVLALGNYRWMMSYWQFTDYSFFAFPTAGQHIKLPPDRLTIFPAADTFAVFYNSGGSAASQFQTEIANSSARERSLLLVNQSGEISGTNARFEQHTQKLPLTGTGLQLDYELSCEVFQLKRIYGTLSEDTAHLALLPAQCEESFRRMQDKLFALAPENEILQLNIWLASPETGTAFYLPPGAVSAADQLPEGVIFYAITPKP